MKGFTLIAAVKYFSTFVTGKQDMLWWRMHHATEGALERNQINISPHFADSPLAH
jgi:hypothetical protein